MTDQEQKKQLQSAAGIPHLPTDLTYECRIAITGEGERAYDWQDKPHRLVYDLCRQVEADADRIQVLVNDNHRWKMECEEFWREREFAAQAQLAKAAEAVKNLKSQWHIRDLVSDDFNTVLAELEQQ